MEGEVLLGLACDSSQSGAFSATPGSRQLSERKMAFVLAFGVFKTELGESSIFLNSNLHNIESMPWLRYFLLVFCC